MTKPYKRVGLDEAQAQLAARDAKAADAIKYVKALKKENAAEARARVLERILLEAPKTYASWSLLSPIAERMALEIYAEHLKCEEQPDGQ